MTYRIFFVAIRLGRGLYAPHQFGVPGQSRSVLKCIFKRVLIMEGYLTEGREKTRILTAPEIMK